MVSIWLTKVKRSDKSSAKPQYEKNRPRRARPIFVKSRSFPDRLTGDIAGYGWFEDPPDHAGRWKTARRGIRRPSGYNGCRPPRAREVRHGQRRRLRPCGG